MKQHPNAKEIALRRISEMRAELSGKVQPINEHYLASQAAAYVGATVDQVKRWVAGK
jgi:hypothetical protein